MNKFRCTVSIDLQMQSLDNKIAASRMFTLLLAGVDEAIAMNGLLYFGPHIQTNGFTRFAGVEQNNVVFGKDPFEVSVVIEILLSSKSAAGEDVVAVVTDRMWSDLIGRGAFYDEDGNYPVLSIKTEVTVDAIC